MGRLYQNKPQKNTINFGITFGRLKRKKAQKNYEKNLVGSQLKIGSFDLLCNKINNSS